MSLVYVWGLGSKVYLSAFASSIYVKSQHKSSFCQWIFCIFSFILQEMRHSGAKKREDNPSLLSELWPYITPHVRISNVSELCNFLQLSAEFLTSRGVKFHQHCCKKISESPNWKSTPSSLIHLMPLDWILRHQVATSVGACKLAWFCT